MACYVDASIHRYRGMVMCHLWADTEDELMAMVDRIGVDRRWVQRPPAASWLHFDIAKSKRALAVAAGAIETDRYGPSLHVARLKGDQAMIDRIERLRARGVVPEQGDTGS